jgi:hypothetical protein
MGVAVNSCAAYTGLVEKYVGSAYDTVKFVADNMSQIEKLLTDYEQISEFHLGIFPTPPTEGNDGEPLKNGNTYFNEETYLTYTYYHGLWIPMGSQSANVDVIVVDESHIVGLDTVLPVPSGYAPGTNSLMVMVQGVHQYSTGSDPTGAYSETSSTTITFVGTHLLIGEIVTLTSSVPVTTGLVYYKEAYTTVGSGESGVTLPNSLEYVIGANTLDVYVDGLYQNLGIDYTESSTTGVSFNSPLGAAGTVVSFKLG